MDYFHANHATHTLQYSRVNSEDLGVNGTPSSKNLLQIACST